MLAIIAVLLLILLLGGFGFSLHLLWIVAAVLLVLFILGFAVHPGGPGRPWW